MGDAKDSSSPRDLGRVALVVAHPGHELMIHHWLELHQPLYCCLTDGSGGGAEARLASTLHLLQGVGSRPARLFGRYPDREVYRLLLDRRVDVFVGLADELADILTHAEVDAVVGDAAEGFNPVHDVCRFIIDGAVARVQRRTGRVLGNHDFVLDGDPGTCPELLRSLAMWLRLNEAALQRKIDAALGYPELREETRFALQRFGKQAFAVECLRPTNTQRMLEQFEVESPAYEEYGRIRGDQGRYRQVIRYREHVFAVRQAIEEAQSR